MAGISRLTSNGTHLLLMEYSVISSGSRNRAIYDTQAYMFLEFQLYGPVYNVTGIVYGID